MSPNPLLEPPAPHGMQPFADIRPGHYRPALEQAIAEREARVDAIAADPAPPDLANTVEALEFSGTRVQYIHDAFTHQVTAGGEAALTGLEQDIAVLLSRHEGRIVRNRRLVARIDAVHAGRDRITDPQSRALTVHWWRRMRRVGAMLPAEAARELGEVNRELSRQCAAYRQTLIEDTHRQALAVPGPDALRGLPADRLAATADEAASRGRPEPWHVLPLTSSTSQPALVQLRDRDTRRTLFERSLGRGADNEERAARIARLRARQARILGYPSYAAWATEDQTTGTPEAVEAMFRRLAEPLLHAAHTERRALRARAGHRIRAWDWTHHAAAGPSGDGGENGAEGPTADELRAHFELDAVITRGLFHSAGLLYGLEFAERHDLTAHHPEARVFQVTDEHAGTVGLFLIDVFSRPGKRGGAWTGILRPQAHTTATRPVVVNTFNLTPPGAGRPCLLDMPEVITLFHEFGHALHALLSDVRYPAHSAPGVPRDFSEAPAQVHESWAFDEQLLEHYARHHRTGQPLPPEWIKQVSERHSTGGVHLLVEILGAAAVDWSWHTLPGGPEGPDDQGGNADWDAARIEARGAARWGLDKVPEIPPRYRSGYFDHVFHGPYGAGFYAYLWSEIIAANLVEALEKRGGLTRASGEALRTMLAAGGSRAAMAMFHELTGLDQPRIEPFLRRRGLPDIAPSSLSPNRTSP
ncbi:M3 family metallopeptidase [Streptomyces sp. NBC_00019]|uniref:M3 family metallopeptidase n=1 Tax=Streptomyces sp. NBC_00019 TaxID=2975623 RepID=UPI0032563D84